MRLILKLLVKFGIHGKRHEVAEAKVLNWMSMNGIGA